MDKLRKALLEEKKEKTSKKKNGKMLSRLHELDDKIEEFIDGLENEINVIEDNPMFVKKAHQLLANMSKEYSEFIMALRSVVNAVDRKGQMLPMFDRFESKIRDIRDGMKDEQEPPPMPDESEEEEDDDGEFIIAKKDNKKKKKKNGIKEALEK